MREITLGDRVQFYLYLNKKKEKFIGIVVATEILHDAWDNRAIISYEIKCPDMSHNITIFADDSKADVKRLANSLDFIMEA